MLAEQAHYTLYRKRTRGAALYQALAIAWTSVGSLTSIESGCQQVARPRDRVTRPSTRLWRTNGQHLSGSPAQFHLEFPGWHVCVCVCVRARSHAHSIVSHNLHTKQIVIIQCGPDGQSMSPILVDSSRAEDIAIKKIKAACTDLPRLTILNNGNRDGRAQKFKFYGAAVLFKAEVRVCICVYMN